MYPNTSPCEITQLYHFIQFLLCQDVCILSHRGFGFITFSDARAAQDVIDKVPHILDGKQVTSCNQTHLHAVQRFLMLRSFGQRLVRTFILPNTVWSCQK